MIRSETRDDTDVVNPLGLDGFAFAEFTSPDLPAMAAQFERLGFVPAARHGASTLYRQGRIAILLSAGMAATHAAVTKVRTLSLLISCGFALMGVGIGVVTAVHP